MLRGGYLSGVMYFCLGHSRAGRCFHGDLHGGNVMVTDFLGDVTLIDFGTSILAGVEWSMKRHARMVNELAVWLLPELREYLGPFPIQDLVTLEYATIAVDQWVRSASALQELEKELITLSDHDLDRRPHRLAAQTASTHINIYEPVTNWLASKGLSAKHLNVYKSASREELASRWRQRRHWPPRVGLPPRPVAPVKSWITDEWLADLKLFFSRRDRRGLPVRPLPVRGHCGIPQPVSAAERASRARRRTRCGRGPATAGRSCACSAREDAENIPAITPLLDSARLYSVMLAFSWMPVRLLIARKVLSVVLPDVIAHPPARRDEVGRMFAA
jgi:hypothetical protein